MRGWRRCPLRNGLKNPFKILQDIVVPDAQDGEALVLEKPCSSSVIILLLSMLPAIDFDDQMSFETDQIKDIRAKRYLAAELQAVELTVAERAPEPALRLGLITAQGPGAVPGGRGRPLALPPLVRWVPPSPTRGERTFLAFGHANIP